jgi:hypothetical protein
MCPAPTVWRRCWSVTPDPQTGRRRFVGRVDHGLLAPTRRRLAELLAGSSTPISPFLQPVPAPGHPRWPLGAGVGAGGGLRSPGAGGGGPLPGVGGGPAAARRLPRRRPTAIRSDDHLNLAEAGRERGDGRDLSGRPCGSGQARSHEAEVPFLLVSPVSSTRAAPQRRTRGPTRCSGE